MIGERKTMYTITDRERVAICWVLATLDTDLTSDAGQNAEAATILRDMAERLVVANRTPSDDATPDEGSVQDRCTLTDRHPTCQDSSQKNLTTNERYSGACPHIRGTVTHYCELNFTLTDEEREAVEVAAAAYAGDHGERFAVTLRNLLERLHT